MAMTSAIMAVPMLAVLGASVNFTRAELGKQKLQAAMDASTLTLARDSAGELDPRAVVQSFLDAYLTNTVLTPADVTYTVTVESGSNGRIATVDATATVDLLFSKVSGVDNITFDLTSTAQISYRDIEVAMVLDISGSMGTRKLNNMKDAAKDFLDIVLANEEAVNHTVVSLIPYSGSVQLGQGFERYLKPSVNLSNWSGCIDSRDELMDDQLIEEDYYDEVDARDYRWGNGNLKWCPPESSKVQFHRNDLEGLKGYVTGMQKGDGTGTDAAIAWGLKALSPAWRGALPGGAADKPVGYDEPALKVLLVLTDGEITDQWRVRSWNPKKNQRVYRKNKAMENFASVCAQAKAKPNVVVYTIGFELKQGATFDLLRDCATSTEHFFEAEGTQVSEVFSFIARQLSDLRLSR